MKPRLHHFLFLLTMTVGCHVQANGIRYIDYHPDRVPSIVTAPGIASEIIFEDDETIEYYTFGFSNAWSSSQAMDHILVFQSQNEQPETNLLVHTNKRNYVFTIVSGKKDWEVNPDRSGAVYSLRIRYHDSKSKAAQKAKDEQQVLRNRDLSANYIYHNYDYRATDHATDIIPTRAWDNGTLTFMTFPQGAKRGVVYELQADGKAALLNQHTEKNGLLVIHGVYPSLIIRLGDEAVEIRRNNIGGRRENYTKTNVASTWRTTSGNAPTEFDFSGTPVKGLERAKIFSEPSPPKSGAATPTVSEDGDIFIPPTP
jgi:virB9